ncbi:hypothetical protein FAZ15_19910 [Sphingobacterium olei]|uniref:Uncharacterized protein n=1 Tax=Sphingobacterium olei TaxID=2571155 RepID=A0A4U0NCS4_9SPHI|nr:hypothetical protein [Sphingobacterium olei]TJZ51815.1 hypothetical protein FAZ15_19910 [Sphingobacterium olei]
MQSTLTEKDIYEVLRQTLPRQNDFASCDYTEELQELLDFGVTSKLMFLDLIVRHRQEVLAIDEDPLDDFHVQYYKSEYGEEYIDERIKDKFWFAYPALIRITLELEFGEKYKSYSNKRDNI